MNIAHKRTFNDVVITLETLDEVRILRAILGELADSDIKDLCEAEEIMDIVEANKMTDRLYDKLSEIVDMED